MLSTYYFGHIEEKRRRVKKQQTPEDVSDKKLYELIIFSFFLSVLILGLLIFGTTFQI